MKKEDARTLKPAVQEQLRKQAIRLRKRGMSFIEIGKIVGVRRETAGKWWRLY